MASDVNRPVERRAAAKRPASDGRVYCRVEDFNYYHLDSLLLLLERHRQRRTAPGRPITARSIEFSSAQKSKYSPLSEANLCDCNKGPANRARECTTTTSNECEWMREGHWRKSTTKGKSAGGLYSANDRFITATVSPRMRHRVLALFKRQPPPHSTALCHKNSDSAS
jgi:hypothetical protein